MRRRSIPTLTDLDLPLTLLDPHSFPGVGFPILVHSGFAATQSRFGCMLVLKLEYFD